MTTAISGKKMPASFTKLECYSTRCPRRCLLEHIERIPAVSDFHADKLREMGSLMHRFIRIYLEELLREQPRLSTSPERAAALIPDVFEGRPASALTEADFEEFAWLARSFSERHRLPADGTVLVEQRFAIRRYCGSRRSGFEACDYDDPDAALRMRLDYAEVHGTRAAVKDWKTGWPGLARDPFQLECYAYIFQCHYLQLEAIDVSYEHLRAGQTEGPFHFDGRKLRHIAEKLDRELARYERETEFPPRPSLSQCTICPVSYACPAQPSGLEQARTREEAIALTMDLALIETKRQRLQAALKGYTSDAGPLRVDGIRVETETRPKLEIDIEARRDGNVIFDETLKLCGLDPRAFLQVNARKVASRGLLQHELVGPLLRSITTQTLERRFSRRKDREP